MSICVIQKTRGKTATITGSTHHPILGRKPRKRRAAAPPAIRLLKNCCKNLFIYARFFLALILQSPAASKDPKKIPKEG